MVGSAAHAAAVEERQRRLQEYLAAKGKLKCPNTKPYLKDQKQCSKPPTSRSSTRPKNDTARWTQSRAAGRPTGNVLQPGSSNVDKTQRPKPEAPKIPKKGPIAVSLSSKSDHKLSGNAQNQQLQKMASSALHKMSRKSMLSSKAQYLRKSAEQKTTTNQRTARWMNSMTELPDKNQLLYDFPKELDKENQPLPTIVELKRKPETGFCNPVKSKSNSCNPNKRDLISKQAVDKGAKKNDLLKYQVNRPFVHKIQVWVPTEKSQQQLPKGTVCERPKDKNPKTVLSHSVHNLARAQESKKLVIKREDRKVNKDEKGHGGIKLQENGVIKQNIERNLSRTKSVLPLMGKFNRSDNGKQDPRLIQPCTKRKPSVMGLPSRAMTQQAPLMGDISKGHTHEPRKSQYNFNLKKEPQTLESKIKRTVPWNCSVRGLNSKALPCVSWTKPTTSEVEMQEPALLEASIPQVKSNTQQKRVKEDRRKKLEEWLASKGKTYKRPPMKLLTQNKKVQKFNLSFWESMKEEEEKRKTELDLSNKINSTLEECLKLVDEGAKSDEILSILSDFPEAEKFAAFWICKAKLLANKDSSEVIELYEAAVRCGAQPIQELREVVLNILKTAKRTIEGITTETNTSVEEVAKEEMAEEETEEEETEKEEETAREQTAREEMAREEMAKEAYFLLPRETVQFGATPQIARKGEDLCLLPCIKLQITPMSR
ncbi:cytoskeleton-associated protein 2-like isoform X2 [Macrotis lagotis]